MPVTIKSNKFNINKKKPYINHLSNHLFDLSINMIVSKLVLDFHLCAHIKLIWAIYSLSISNKRYSMTIHIELYSLAVEYIFNG